MSDGRGRRLPLGVMFCLVAAIAASCGKNDGCDPTGVARRGGEIVRIDTGEGRIVGSEQTGGYVAEVAQTPGSLELEVWKSDSDREGRSIPVRPVQLPPAGLAIEGEDLVAQVDGAVLWRQAGIGGTVLGDVSGSILVLAGRQLRAVRASDGNLLWNATGGEPTVRLEHAQLSDGMAYTLGTRYDRQTFRSSAFAAAFDGGTGVARWEVPLSGGVAGKRILVEGDTVIVAHRSTSSSAVDQVRVAGLAAVDGTPRWEHTINQPELRALVAGENDAILVATGALSRCP